MAAWSIPDFRDYHLPSFADVPRTEGVFRGHRGFAGPDGRQIDERKSLQSGGSRARQCLCRCHRHPFTTVPFKPDRLWPACRRSLVDLRRAPDAARHECCAAEPGPILVDNKWVRLCGASPKRRCTASGHEQSPSSHRAFDLAVRLVGRQKTSLLLSSPNAERFIGIKCMLGQAMLISEISGTAASAASPIRYRLSCTLAL